MVCVFICARPSPPRSVSSYLPTWRLAAVHLLASLHVYPFCLSCGQFVYTASANGTFSPLLQGQMPHYLDHESLLTLSVPLVVGHNLSH